MLDAHGLRTGYRQEGTFSAALSFSGQAMSGIGSPAGGLILTLIDFPTQAEPGTVPAEVVQRLGAVVGLLVPLLYVVSISLITRSRVTRARHAEIRAALAARRGDAVWVRRRTAAVADGLDAPMVLRRNSPLIGSEDNGVGSTALVDSGERGDPYSGPR